eukprot:2681915-Rhodomonas_salina.2
MGNAGVSERERDAGLTAWRWCVQRQDCFGFVPFLDMVCALSAFKALIRKQLHVHIGPRMVLLSARHVPEFTPETC